jgi:hypothetical protein
MRNILYIILESPYTPEVSQGATTGFCMPLAATLLPATSDLLAYHVQYTVRVPYLI